MAHMSHHPIKAYGGESCHWCGRTLLPTGTMVSDGRSHPLAGTREHLIPRSLGGSNSCKNIVLVCYTCNHKRGNMPLDEWVMKIRK